MCSLVEADAIPEAGVTKWAGSFASPQAPAQASAAEALDEVAYA